MLFAQLLRRFSSELRRELRNDVTGPQLFLLEMLRENGPLKMSDLAERLRVTVGAVTLQANRLIKMGYVERTRSEEDRRVVMLSITETGRELADEYREIRERVMQVYFGKLTQEELRELGRLYGKMLDEPPKNRGKE